MERKNKHMVVLGNDSTALYIAILAKEQGYIPFLSANATLPAEVKIALVTNQIAFEEGQHSANRLANASCVVIEEKTEATTVVATTVKAITIAAIHMMARNDVQIYDYTQALTVFSNTDFILIAGEAGKSSTANMLKNLLEQMNYRIGVSSATAKSLTKLLKQELDIAILLADTQDTALFETLSPKLILWVNQYGVPSSAAFVHMLHRLNGNSQLLFNADDEEITKVLNQTDVPLNAEPFSSAFIHGNNIQLPTKSNVTIEGKLLESSEPFQLSISPKVMGYQAINTLVACMAARTFQIPTMLIRPVLKSYVGLAHRMEFLEKVNAIQIVNNAMANGLEASRAALEACEPSIVWVTRGCLTPTLAFTELVCRKVKAIVYLEDSTSIEQHFGELVYSLHQVESMTEAVQIAYHLAERDDTILYSPFEERNRRSKNTQEIFGEQFKTCVEEQLRPLENPGLEIIYSPERKYA